MKGNTMTEVFSVTAAEQPAVTRLQDRRENTPRFRAESTIEGCMYEVSASLLSPSF